MVAFLFGVDYRVNPGIYSANVIVLSGRVVQSFENIVGQKCVVFGLIFSRVYEPWARNLEFRWRRVVNKVGEK